MTFLTFLGNENVINFGTQNSLRKKNEKNKFWAAAAVKFSLFENFEFQDLILDDFTFWPVVKDELGYVSC